MTIYLKQYTEVPNAGDVASARVAAHVTGRPVHVIGEPPHGAPHLIGIGSILHWSDPESSVWGSGFIADWIGLPATPRRVLATRGPLTRDRLRRLGVACPDLLGDPGIFAPEIVAKPPSSGAIGVVPHAVDADEPFVHRARAAGAIVLDVQAPLDEYLSSLAGCRAIVRSSLHGLVFAHAYGIPAAWIHLSDRVHGDGFKFRDYYASVGVSPEAVRPLPSTIGVAEAVEACELPPDRIDREGLRQALLAALPELTG